MPRQKSLLALSPVIVISGKRRTLWTGGANVTSIVLIDQ
jgi:hypothetical protein